MLEAVTRDMDERCEFQDGIFAILLPGVDEANALAVAERLQSQVRQCKVRMGDGLWNITASIGLANSAVGLGVVEVMRSAEGRDEACRPNAAATRSASASRSRCRRSCGGLAGGLINDRCTLRRRGWRLRWSRAAS